MTTTADEQILNRETDKLNDLLRRAEQVLIGKQMGVSATASIPGLGGYVTFAKVDQKWGLWYARREQDLEVSPLTSVSREIRVIAVRALPALYEEMLAQVNQQLSTVLDAQKAVQSFINSLTITVSEAKPLSMAEETADYHREA